MTDPLDDPAKYTNVSEIYEVVRTVRVWVKHRHLQVEVLKCYRPSATRYEVRYWDIDKVHLQRVYSKSGERGGEAAERRILMDNPDLPWVGIDDPDLALNEALVFLNDLQ